MSLQNIIQQRLTNQQLATSKFKNPVELLRWFGAMQAQEYAPTKWSFGLRLPKLTDDTVEKEFTSGKILRTHVLRPTWHFVAAEDIRWMLELTRHRVHAANAFMYRQCELDKKLFTKCTKIIIQSLEGKKELTRELINANFKKNKIKAEGHRLSYLMMHAELEGIICSGARQGNQFTYALLDERVPQAKSKTPEEALAELTTLYYTSRGPATVQDFSTWSGLTLTECRKGIEILKDEIQEEVFDNQHYFSFETAKKKPAPVLQLLPIYDEYIMGYKNRDAMLQVYNSIKPTPSLGYDNTIIFNGQIIGTWKRVIKSKSIQLMYHPFKPFDERLHAEFTQAISRYEKFTGLEVSIQ